MCGVLEGLLCGVCLQLRRTELALAPIATERVPATPSLPRTRAGWRVRCAEIAVVRGANRNLKSDVTRAANVTRAAEGAPRDHSFESADRRPTVQGAPAVITVRCNDRVIFTKKCNNQYM